MKKPLFFYLFYSIALTSCQDGFEEKNNPSDYNWSSPEKSYSLPENLKEISGLIYINDSLFACIQDEEGKLFFLNPHTSAIVHTAVFAGEGDYEDLAKRNEDYFILRSDGMLFKYSDDKTTLLDSKISRTENLEGLVYDASGNRLLLSAKEGKRSVYVFDLTDMSLEKDPLFSLEHAYLSPTSIGIHPVTKEIFILTKDYIVVTDQAGNIKQEEKIAKTLFPQPEGISFKSNGDVFISNEGKGKRKATILEFKYQSHEK